MPAPSSGRTSKRSTAATWPRCARVFVAGATWVTTGDLPVAGTYRGADEIIDGFLARMLERLDPDAELGRQLAALVGSDDVAVAEWSAHVVATRGERYENDYCGVCETCDGKITAVREYFDTERMGAVLFGR